MADFLAVTIHCLLFTFNSSRLNDIREGPLHPSEISGAGDEEYQCGSSRNIYHRTRRICPQESPAKSLHDTYHRVQPVQSSPGLRKETAGVDDRCGKHPDLGEEREHEPEITVLCRQR